MNLHFFHFTLFWAVSKVNSATRQPQVVCARLEKKWEKHSVAVISFRECSPLTHLVNLPERESEHCPLLDQLPVTTTTDHRWQLHGTLAYWLRRTKAQTRQQITGNWPAEGEEEREREPRECLISNASISTDPLKRARLSISQPCRRLLFFLSLSLAPVWITITDHCQWMDSAGTAQHPESWCSQSRTRQQQQQKQPYRWHCRACR